MLLKSSIKASLIIAIYLTFGIGCSEAPIYYGKTGKRKDMVRQPEEKPQYIPVDITFSPPVNNFRASRITSGFGLRKDSKYNYKEFHKGIDIKLEVGDHVIASASGKVSFAGNKRGYGKVVIIDHGKRIYTVYAHLSSIKCSEGVQVRRGEIIGWGGRSGNASGSHLHFEIRKSGVAVNPLQYLDY